MVSLKEIVNSLYGAYLLARRDPDALSYFNISTEGFYHSFAAMILAVPLFIFESAIDYKALATETAIVPFLLLLCLALWREVYRTPCRRDQPLVCPRALHWPLPVYRRRPGVSFSG